MTHNPTNPESLANLSSAALTARLTELVGDERRCIVDFLWHLAEMDRRSTHLDLGYPSLFAYCTEALRLPKASAWRRTTAARLLVQFPLAAEYLADGRLCLTTFVLLKDLLTPENHRELLDRAALLSEDAVKVLVATLQPRPEVKESIRRLPSLKRVIAGSSFFRSSPEASTATRGSGPEPSIGNLPHESELRSAIVGSGPELGIAVTSGSWPELAQDAARVSRGMPAPPRPARIEPIDSERSSVNMTVGPEFMAALPRVKSALSHLVPDGDLEALILVCFLKTLELCERRKIGGRRAASASEGAPEISPLEEVPPNASITVSLPSDPNSAGTCARSPSTSAPETGSGPEPESTATVQSRLPKRYIPVEVRRAVWKRDRGSCSFRGEQGKRCSSKHQLEFDHQVPFACGGPATVENVFLRCRSHNQHRARQFFGAEHMALFSASARRSSADQRRRALSSEATSEESLATAIPCRERRNMRERGPPADPPLSHPRS